MKRNREKGQAITEFVVCLIGIVFIFLGLLAVAILSMENVRCILDARSDVDVASSAGSSIGGNPPQPIVEWSYGNDQIPFTADDSPVNGMVSAYPNEFDTQINSITDADGGSDPSIPLKDRLFINPISLTLLAERNYADGKGANMTFLDGAGLNGATITVRDPLSKRGLPDLEKLIRKFTGNATFKLTDTVYMPARVD